MGTGALPWVALAILIGGLILILIVMVRMMIIMLAMMIMMTFGSCYTYWRPYTYSSCYGDDDDDDCDDVLLMVMDGRCYT